MLRGFDICNEDKFLFYFGFILTPDFGLILTPDFGLMLTPDFGLMLTPDFGVTFSLLESLITLDIKLNIFTILVKYFITTKHNPLIFNDLVKKTHLINEV